MTKRIQTDKVPEGYVLDMDTKDNLNRHWKFRASPVKGGSIAYFNKLSDLVKWSKQVKEIRCMQEGHLTFQEKILNALYSNDISQELADKLLLS